MTEIICNNCHNLEGRKLPEVHLLPRQFWQIQMFKSSNLCTHTAASQSSPLSLSQSFDFHPLLFFKRKVLQHTDSHINQRLNCRWPAELGPAGPISLFNLWILRAVCRLHTAYFHEWRNIDFFFNPNSYLEATEQLFVSTLIWPKVKHKKTTTKKQKFTQKGQVIPIKITRTT